MNAMKILKEGIFASSKDFLLLSKMESARILVISDSHGYSPMLKEIVSKFGADVQAMVFCGDGIYDLLSADFKKLPPVVGFVRGNNDPSSVVLKNGLFEKRISVPSQIQLTVCEKKILVCHGNDCGVYYSVSGAESVAQMQGCQAVVFGHTHVPCENMHVIYSMNPGSISSPRRASKLSFAILEVNANHFSSVFYKIEEGINPSFVPYIPDYYY